jgi:hypothetical protein
MAYDPIGTVELTDEERAAASAFIRTLSPPGETMVVKSEFVDETQRALYALAILGLADRLTTEGRLRNDPASIFRGQTAAVKAFVIYPIAVNIYECARILACSGKTEEARELFLDFLARCESEPAGVVRDKFTASHDMRHLISGAKLFLATGVAPVS